MKTVIGSWGLVVLLGFAVTTARSNEADELREKAKAIQREAEQLAKQGRKEESQKLAREAKELLHAAEKHEAAKPSKESDREIDELHQRLKTLAEKERVLKESQNEEGLAELRKHRATVERELEELHQHRERKLSPKHGFKRSPEFPEPLQEAGRRLKHLHVAIENLHAAGMHDVAEELTKRAEAMEREFHHAREQFAKEQESAEQRKHFEPDRKQSGPKGKFSPGHAPIDELREELHRLRAELNELREQIKKR